MQFCSRNTCLETYGRYSGLSTAVLQEGAGNYGLIISPYPVMNTRPAHADRRRNHKLPWRDQRKP